MASAVQRLSAAFSSVCVRNRWALFGTAQGASFEFSTTPGWTRCRPDRRDRLSGTARYQPCASLSAQKADVIEQHRMNLN
jgi:hypothetical protein